jgi:hypothetical protein
VRIKYTVLGVDLRNFKEKNLKTVHLEFSFNTYVVFKLLCIFYLLNYNKLYVTFMCKFIQKLVRFI